MSELRTGVNGHPSYRAMMQEASRQVLEREPWMRQVIGFVNYCDPGNKIARSREQSRIAGKNLKTGVDGSVDY